MKALSLDKYLISLITVIYVSVNLFFVFQGNYYLNLIPPAIIAGLVAVFAPEKLFWFIVFTVPLSLNMEDYDLGGFSFYFPTEPCLFTLMFLFVINQMARKTIDTSVMKHPVTLAILFHLFWIAFTSITSMDPFVSLKFLVVRMWFIVPGYFMFLIILKRKETFRIFLWLYLISLTIVVAYTLIHHAMFDFGEEPAHWVMYPFFKDHTSYGAVLAMMFPAALGLYFSKKTGTLEKPLLITIITIIGFGIVFSYTRAAWVSLIAALGVYLVMWLRVKASTIIVGLFIAAFSFFSFYDQIMVRLEMNKVDSSDNLGEHVSSISNIATDASNLERINRWTSAIDMFKEKPFFGWGPGNYQFYYAKFQRPENLTIISTNAGDGGNAHSEYLGPLAEQGVLGMFSILLLMGTVSYAAIRTYKRLEAGEERMLLMVAFTGLITYYTHGVLNNYLDTDKASIPFWGFTAMIVAIDVYHSRLKNTETEDSRIV